MTNVISVLSPCSDVGKTITAINLAAAFTKRNHKVLLVDTDICNDAILWDSKRPHQLFCTVSIPRYESLRSVEKLIGAFDYVIIDGYSIPGTYVYKALSDFILIPVLPCEYTIFKTSKLLDEINSHPADKQPKVFGLFNRTNRGEQVDSSISKRVSELKLNMLSARLNEHDLINKTYFDGKSIYCDGESVQCSEFNSIVEEIIARIR